VLYNHEEEYSRGLAELFRKSWEESYGPSSVLAYESFGQKDRDFSAQLQRIAGSGAELLYMPVYYNHAALIVPQAEKLGWGQKPIMGSDSWSSSDLFPLSNGSVIGCYFTTNFTAAGGLDNARAFVDAFKRAYGYNPDEVAALSYDSVQLILQAIQRVGITGKTVKDREALKNALAGTRDFEGVTGRMSFAMTSGNPQKHIMVVRVRPSGEFEYITSL
jgi:branched-chain amino acid transport system substrate-binding protein